MDYYLKNNVAQVVVPPQVTLAGNPAFVELKSKSGSSGQPVNFTLKVKKHAADDLLPKFTIQEIKSGQSYSLEGVTDKSKIDEHAFFVDTSSDAYILAENIRSCLLNRPFFRNNFELNIPFVYEPAEESCINFISKGSGSAYTFRLNFEVESPMLESEGNPTASTDNDTISKNAENCVVELDVYTDTGVFLGETDEPSDNKRGKYLTTLSKTYLGPSVWYDMNTLISRRSSFSTDFLNTQGWCDAGTVSNYRFIARRSDGINNERFYASGVFFVVNGYDYTLNNLSLDDYVLDVMYPQNMKPLTNRLVTTHIQGQKQFFNFLLKDSHHSPGMDITEAKIGLLYTFYNQSGDYLGQRIAHIKNQRSFAIVNTLSINIDEQIEWYESSNKGTVGRVKVALCRGGNKVSEDITFKICPKHLNKVNDFVFLNRLGGWESMNFGGDESSEFKTSGETIHKTLLPQFTISDRIESVSQRLITEQRIVKTSPIKRETVEWLREMSTSVAIFELSTGRYVIADEFTLKSNSKDDLFQVEMKYHYSDSLNGNGQGGGDD